MKTIYVDGEELVARCNGLMDGHVSYKLGAKAAVSKEPSEIAEIDCSGFLQYVLFHAAHAKIKGGSWYQNKWCEDEGFAAVDYDTAGPRRDNILRLGYFSKKSGMTAGHIWLLLNGETLESYSGGTKHGPGRRPWDTKALKKNVDSCYELGPCKKLVMTTGLFPQCTIVNMDMTDSWE